MQAKEHKARNGLAAGLAVSLLLAGCSVSPPRVLTGHGYRPENVFLLEPALRPAIQRVAVLPLVASEQQPGVADARAVLESILLAELGKTRRFEICYVDPQFLRLQTGRAHWTGDEALPPGLMEGLRKTFACDAVLFWQLTTFRGFSPLAIGWRMRLVHLPTMETLWAVDEIVDAGMPSVLADARRYQSAQLQTSGTSQDKWLITNSPRRFGQFAAAELLATLPKRLRTIQWEVDSPKRAILPLKSPKVLSWNPDTHVSDSEMNNQACRQEKVSYGN